VEIEGVPFHVVTDADGYFSIQNIPAGTRKIIVTKDDNNNGIPDYHGTKNINVPENQGTNAGTTSAASTGVVTGHVKLEGLEPPHTDYMGVMVYVPGTSAVAMTNDAGYYYLEGVPCPGSTVMIAAAKACYEGDTVGVYLGSCGKSDQQIPIADDMILKKSADCGGGAVPEYGDITGHAFLYGEEDHAGIKVTLTNGDSTFTGPDGSYSFQDERATWIYNLGASHSGYGTAYYDNIYVYPGGTFFVPDLYLYGDTISEPVGNIIGAVVVEGTTQGISGALVGVAGTTRMAMTDVSGGFTINGLPAGYKTLIAVKNGYQDGSAVALVPEAGDTLIVIPMRANNPPAVQILLPLNGATFAQGETITFVGTATDPDQDNQTLGTRWLMNHYQVLESSPPLDPSGTVIFSTSDLLIGTHLITLQAEDSSGLRAEYSIALSVNPVLPSGQPILCLSPVYLNYGDTLTDLSFNLWNCGDGSLNWSAVPEYQWITIAPASGEVTTETQVIQVTVCPDMDGDGFTADHCGGPDCDDGDSAVYPGAIEVCNGIDDNCNDLVDEGGSLLCDNGEPCDGEEVCAGLSGCQPGPVEHCLVAVTDLAATPVAPSRITLSWTDQSVNEEYQEIWRALDGAGPFSLIDSVAAGDTGYLDTGLTQDTAYYYYVIPIYTGDTTSPSNIASATTPLLAAPALELVPGVCSFHPMWTPGDPFAEGYEIERARISSGATIEPWSNVTAVFGSSLEYLDLDPGLASGDTYAYQVRAFDLAGNQSPFSNEATAQLGLVWNGFTVETINTPEEPLGITANDLDNDGNQDFAYITINGIEILYGDGDGNFPGNKSISKPLDMSSRVDSRFDWHQNIGASIRSDDFNKDGKYEIFASAYVTMSECFDSLGSHGCSGYGCEPYGWGCIELGTGYDCSCSWQYHYDPLCSPPEFWYCPESCVTDFWGAGCANPVDLLWGSEIGPEWKSTRDGVLSEDNYFSIYISDGLTGYSEDFTASNSFKEIVVDDLNYDSVSDIFGIEDDDYTNWCGNDYFCLTDIVCGDEFTTCPGAPCAYCPNYESIWVNSGYSYVYEGDTHGTFSQLSDYMFFHEDCLVYCDRKNWYSAMTTGNFSGGTFRDVSIVDKNGLKLYSVSSNGQFNLLNSYTPPRFSYVVASGDLDMDGTNDMVVGDCGTLTLFWNDGSGNFSTGPDLTTSVSCPFDGSGERHKVQQPHVTIDDVNLDGVLDIILASGMGGNTNLAVFLGECSGSFSPPYNYALGASNGTNLARYKGDIAVADFNDDGKPDLAVSMSEPNQIFILLQK
jgi:hypothetical protein